MNFKFIYLNVKKFSITEKKRFHQFIKSPYHNSNKLIIKLYEFILKTNDEDLKKEVVHQHLWLNKSYQDANVRQILKQFSDLVETFLALEYLKKEALTLDLISTKEWHKKNEEHLAQHRLNMIKKNLDQHALRNADYWYQKMVYERLVQDILHSPKRDKASNLNQQLHSLERFYLSEKLKIMNLMLAHQNISNNTYEIVLKHEILNLANIEEFKNIAAIHLFQCSYLCFENFELESYYFEYREHLEQEIHFFNSDEQRLLLVTAINYCIKKINNRQANYREELLKWYQYGIQTTILFENGQLTHFTYSNTITIALILKQFDWVKSFIESHKLYLKQDLQDIYYYFNKAKYLYEVGSLREALRLLLNYHFEDKLLLMSSKVLIIKILYELEDFTLLEAHIESTKMFLHREKQVNYHKQSFINFIHIVKQLMLHSGDSKKKDQILKRMNQLESLTERKWLLEKININ